MLYGLQHYLSIIGSLILIPLVTVPAMGGSSVSSSFELLFYSHIISLHSQVHKVAMYVSELCLRLE